MVIQEKAGEDSKNLTADIMCGLWIGKVVMLLQPISGERQHEPQPANGLAINSAAK